jgi:CO/xanthine dehydrogenase Mo-binding subunit
MEPIKIKRRARIVPFGFKKSSDPDYLEPIKEELDALNQAREYSKTCSLRETAQWLHRKTGRYISHVGLKKRLERNSTTETKENSSAESQEVSQTDSSTHS